VPDTGAPARSGFDPAGADSSPSSQSVVRGGAGPVSGTGGAAEALVGVLLAERYRIERLLGTGGMGAVYRAQHVHMRKAVAVKVLHKEMTFLPEVVARFEREAVAAARIEHANVATATDFGRLEDGSFYLVLEYVEGRSLREALKQDGRMAGPRALNVTRQIADALAAAHAAGVVHRDLKPDNVMLLEREGDRDFVKVLDFGIAKVQTSEAKEQLTQLGSVFGTPEYMAPEQAQGIEVDARADLYTVGILLYEMLAGATPFNDDDMIVVLTRTLTMDPPPLPSDVDPAIAALAMQLLRKLPEQRIQSASELVHYIDALSTRSLTPSPVSVGTPSPRSVAYSDTVLSSARPELAQFSRQAAVPGSSAAATAQRIARFTRPSVLVEELKRALPQLERSVKIGGQPVPVWALLATAAVLTVAGAMFAVGLVLSAGDSDELVPASSSRASAAPPPRADPALEALLARARTGDKAALAELQARPQAKRTAPEWLALARGQAKIGQHTASVASYKAAIAGNAALASDRELLRDLRTAADVADSWEAALALASTLGSGGADVVFDVWETHRKTPSKQALSKVAKQYLESDALRAKASPALLVTLDLWKASGCGAFKQLLPRVMESADERAVSKLKSLQSNRGCGFLGLGDCYSCLRGSKDLSQALKNAQSRPAPAFTTPARSP
jgi:eukaryotic-like serine/threonine-protein kinase